jgi:hypothetical protein
MNQIRKIEDENFFTGFEVSDESGEILIQFTADNAERYYLTVSTRSPVSLKICIKTFFGADVTEIISGHVLQNISSDPEKPLYDYQRRISKSIAEQLFAGFEDGSKTLDVTII